MASSYLSPGVYFQEVSTGAPIAGVGTSTAGFIGLAPRAKTPGKPVLVTNMTELMDAFYPKGRVKVRDVDADFERGFNLGWVADDEVLGHAVRGFFMNGGTRCWVVGVPSLAVAGNIDPISDALAAFEVIDEIALVAVPLINVGDARSMQIQNAVLTHCKNLGDRFAILDGFRGLPDNAGAIRGPKTKDAEALATNDYGAVYCPWIQLAPSDIESSNGNNVYAPPCGHIAGIYARVDAARGVHKAPANEVVQGALGLEYGISKAKQDGLNPDGVNAIRDFNGTIKVWGARTLDPHGEFKYINVRRLFNFIKESIDEGTQWTVFEPNSPDLWARITRNVTAFLTNVWSTGALFGDKAEQAFYVKCDAETNPQSKRDDGLVTTEIGVAVVKPAEFVLFRIGQKTGK